MIAQGDAIYTALVSLRNLHAGPEVQTSPPRKVELPVAASMAQLCFELAERRDCDSVRGAEVRPSRGAAALGNLQCVVPDKWADGIVWTRDTLGGLCQPQVQQLVQCRPHSVLCRSITSHTVKEKCTEANMASQELP